MPESQGLKLCISTTAYPWVLGLVLGLLPAPLDMNFPSGLHWPGSSSRLTAKVVCTEIFLLHFSPNPHKIYSWGHFWTKWDIESQKFQILCSAPFKASRPSKVPLLIGRRITDEEIPGMAVCLVTLPPHSLA